MFKKEQKHRKKKIDSELDKEEMLPPKMQKIVDELMGMKVPEYEEKPLKKTSTKVPRMSERVLAGTCMVS